MPSIYYFQLSDLNDKVRVKITNLKGYIFPDELSRLSDPNYSPITSGSEAEMYVTGQIYSNNQPLCLPFSTSYKCFTPRDPMKWNEWITFPVSYRDLSPTSRLVFTVWHIRMTTPTDSSRMAEPVAVPLGGTCLPMFSKKGLLKLGRRKLFLWKDVEGDGSIQTKTPAKTGKTEGLDKLLKRIRSFDQKEVPPVWWLDKLTMKRIDVLRQKEEAAQAASSEGDMFLGLEFPAFKHPVVFHQKTCNARLPEILSFKEKERIFVLHDPEAKRENPIEMYYHRLHRNNDRKGFVDRNLKPTMAEHKELDRLLRSVNHTLTFDQKELLWKYRYSLTDNKKALTKFLRCIDWAEADEAKQALAMMNEWTPIDIADALELLSPAFQNKDVRIYAVKQLNRADDEELGNYLLQLVQALRYEPGHTYPSYLSDFLMSRGSKSFHICNFLHWYVSVEQHDKVMGPMFKNFYDDFLTLLQKSAEGQKWFKILQNEAKLIDQLIALSENAKSKGGRVEKKIERLKASLGPDGEMKELRHFAEPIRIAVRPEIQVTGIAQETTMFKSALAPMLLSFHTTDPNHKHKVIFKVGDDLRQDQLIIQMINLMDTLMKKVKLDMQLTPYRVLATGLGTGFVEYVPESFTLTHVLETYERDIRKFLVAHNPKPSAMAKALDTFVKSTAGYCVITYILGVGDRHMENLLLTKAGHLFHIDFGWVFGRDPKLFPPPMKFSKEMVLAMGGSNSPQLHDFRRYAALAFKFLRQNASLILNLLSLMGDAGIPHLSGDIEKNLLKVEEKFRLDLSDEEADPFIWNMIDESCNALFPKVIDQVHKWAMYWK